MARISSLGASKARAMEFKLHAPQAKKVTLAGNFNNWNTRTTTAKKDKDGNWVIKMTLKPGRYEYKFFVDGNWINDPHRAAVSNAFGTQNSLVEVR